VESLLRELEAQLARMTAADRERVAVGFRALFTAGRELGDCVSFSGRTALAFVQVITLGMASGRALASYLTEANKLAPKVGPHVGALVQALS
jgi:hypothetical protein